ncbi:MAG: TerB family tellurite resistance protein [Halieaceae bacterium]|nr:TerB family tellurite resistance protein [Halieaceae bacterium]
MLARIKALFLEDTDTAERDGHEIDLAAAALLVEVARADHEQSVEEEAAMGELLATSLNLDPEEVQAVLGRAGDAVEDATSLFEFTRLVNDHYSIDEKRRLVRSMWQVALADRDLDKYEEHLIRRVAELIYLPHPEFIQTKHEALAAAGS